MTPSEKMKLLELAHGWFEEAGSHPLFFKEGRPYGVEILGMEPKNAALVACAIALRSALNEELQEDA